MVDGFFKDLFLAKGAEQIVLSTFSELSPNYTFTNVSNEKEYWHKGDILATAADGRKIFIEVKDDGRICDTHNVLCEEEVDYYGDGIKKGNMHSDYQIYCVVSQAENRIYIIDFSILHAIYKQGHYTIIPHTHQTTYAYLLPLRAINEAGGLIAVINYKTKEYQFYGNYN